MTTIQTENGKISLEDAVLDHKVKLDSIKISINRFSYEDTRRALKEMESRFGSGLHIPTNDKERKARKIYSYIERKLAEIYDI